MKMAQVGLFSLLAVCFALPALARGGGHDVGNGGDSLVIEIMRTAARVAVQWENVRPQCANRLPMRASDFVAVVKKAIIETTPEPIYLEDSQGRRVFKEAVNYPSQMRIVFHRDSFQKSELRDALIIHEFLGLAGIKDQAYGDSNLILEAIRRPDCRKGETGESEGRMPEPGENWPRDLFPDSTAVDANGVVYIVDKKYQSVFRFDSNKNQALKPWLLRWPVQRVKYSIRQNRIYLDSTDNRLIYFDLSTSQESQGKVLLISPVPIGDFTPLDQRIVIAPKPSGSWSKLFLYDVKGNLIQERDWVFSTSALYADEGSPGLFFVSSGISPVDIFFLPLFSGKLNGLRESPYHEGSSIRFKGPLIATSGFPRMVLMGSGQILSHGELNLAASLPHEVIGGTWMKGRLVSVNSANAFSFDVKLWDSRFLNEEAQRNFSGVFVNIYEAGGRLVLVYVDENARLQILVNPLQEG